MKRAITLFLFSILYTGVALADSLSILDTTGVVRAQQELDPKGNSVQFTVTDDKGNIPNDVEVTLTNKETGAKLTAVSKGGVVLFEHITAGNWIVSTTASNIVFTAVTIVPLELAGGLGALGLSTSTLVAGGGITAVTATTIAIAANNNGSSDPMSPSS